MTDPAGLDAAIRLGTQNAERIAGLNTALDGLSARLGELGTAVDGIQGTIADQAGIVMAVPTPMAKMNPSNNHALITPMNVSSPNTAVTTMRYT